MYLNMVLENGNMNSLQRFAVNKIAGSDFISRALGANILKWSGFKIGKNVLIRQHVFFDSNSVEIGDGSFINRFCSFQDGGHNAKLTVGQRVAIGPNCVFLGATHEFGDAQRRARKARGGDITIGNGCWIGGNVTILPGVMISEGCIIGAGSVVTKNTEKNSLYVGVPAKKVRNL